MRKFLVAGNWKMNGTAQSVDSLTTSIISKIEVNQSVLDKCDFLCCPSYIHLTQVSSLLGSSSDVHLGAQDCSSEEQGAHTGDVSADMLADLGIKHVILGHSERREDHKETSSLIHNKAVMAKASGLHSLICIGETSEERSSGKAKEIVSEQLKESVPAEFEARDFTVAYEPVWAIGSGQAASSEDIEEMHDFIRNKLSEMVDNADTIRILYGGSVKPENAAELSKVSNVDGFLIGGASLKADSFVDIGIEVAKN